MRTLLFSCVVARYRCLRRLRHPRLGVTVSVTVLAIKLVSAVVDIKTKCRKSLHHWKSLSPIRGRAQVVKLHASLRDRHHRWARIQDVALCVWRRTTPCTGAFLQLTRSSWAPFVKLAWRMFHPQVLDAINSCVCSKEGWKSTFLYRLTSAQWCNWVRQLPPLRYGWVHWIARRGADVFYFGWKLRILADQDERQRCQQDPFANHQEFQKHAWMPFELRSAPAMFQRAMEAILLLNKWKLPIVYIDDIIIILKMP